MTILRKYVLYWQSAITPLLIVWIEVVHFTIWHLMRRMGDGWRLDLMFDCLSSWSLQPLCWAWHSGAEARPVCGLLRPGMMTPAPSPSRPILRPAPSRHAGHVRMPLDSMNFLEIINHVETTCGKVSNFRYLKTNCFNIWSVWKSQGHHTFSFSWVVFCN